MKTRTERLRHAIATVEAKQAQELQSLKEQYHLTYESLKPVNLIKNTLHDAATSPELKNNLLNNIIGLASGYLSRKVLIGRSSGPVKRLFGTLMQFAVTNFVARHSDKIKSAGENILQQINKYRKERKPVHHHNGHEEYDYND